MLSCSLHTDQLQIGVFFIFIYTSYFAKISSSKTGVSNSNCSVGHMRTYKVTRGPHYDADATIAVPELNFRSSFLRNVS